MSKTVQFQIIQFCISTQFKCKYSLIVKNISGSSYSVLFLVHVKTVPCQTIHFKYSFNVKKQFYLKSCLFSIYTQFKCKYDLTVKNISISSYSV